MFRLSASLLCLSAATLAAQTAPPTPAPQAKAPASVIAGIPVNYDEAKVGTYT